MYKSKLYPRSSRIAWIFCAGALTVLLALSAMPGQAPKGDAAPSTYLPFDMPSTAVLRGTGREVFVNYFTPVPLSLDNKPADVDYYTRNYLNPNGENNKHVAYGGLLRDRPIPRAPLPAASYRLQDLKTEVNQAIAAGIDGFYLDILQLEGDPDVRVWQTTQLMMQAAAEVDPGFKIVLMPDMTSSMKNKSVATMAKYVAQLAASPSAYRLADGRLVIMPSAPEAHTVSWWTDFMTTMKSQYNMPIALVPIFIASETSLRDTFAPISYGMSIWGSSNPLWNDPNATYRTSIKGRAAAIHALGKIWVQPVRVQGERPNQGLYAEAENTTNFRDMWQLARETGAEWVQMPTWNDYSEGTQLAPSVKHGYTYLDINAYYLTWYKTGAPPRIVRDTVYLTHRTQPYAAQPTFHETKLMVLRGGSPARDTVEALTFLTAPGTVTITSGASTQSCSAPAGVSTCTVPLHPGDQSVTVNRGSATVASAASPYPVTSTPYVQDLQYVGVSSGRPAGAGSGASPSSTPNRSRYQAEVQGTRRQHVSSSAPAPTS